MIENSRDEEVCRAWDVLADEDHTYHLSEKEYFYYKNKWWISLNKSGHDTQPLRKRSDFKQALSTLNVYTKKLEETNSSPFLTGSTNNGDQHRVLPLFGGNGKNPEGRGKQRLVIDRGNPLFTELWRKHQRNGFQEFILFCYS